MLGDHGAEALAALLQVNSTLLYLGLRGNGIKCDGARTFANVLAHNSTLQSLDLGKNEVTEECVARFARSLRVNTTLQYIDVSHNLITNKGARVLARALAHRPIFTKISSYDNLMSDDAMAGIDASVDTVRAKLTYSARKNAMVGRDLMDLKNLISEAGAAGRRRSHWKKEFAPKARSKIRAVVAFAGSAGQHRCEHAHQETAASGGSSEAAATKTKSRMMTMTRKGRGGGSSAKINQSLK